MKLLLVLIAILAAYRAAAWWSVRIQADPFSEPWGDC